MDMDERGLASCLQIQKSRRIKPQVFRSTNPAMASVTPSLDLIEGTLCPFCKDPMENPVRVSCSHSFCKNCIDHHSVKRREMEEMLCPVCQAKIKEEDIRPNWQLKRPAEEVRLCVTHKEKLHLFCKEDQELLCCLCEKGGKHKNHFTLPLEIAAPMYKDQIKNHIKTLMEKLKDLLSCKADTVKESQGMLEQVKVEKEKTVRTFRQLLLFLEEQEKQLLAQMEEVVEEIERERENHLDKLEKEHRALESIIQELEEKLHQPGVDLLQDIGNCMERFEAWKNCGNSPITFPAALNWKVWDFSDINPFLEGIAKQFQGSLVSGLQLQKANVHLNPETAQPKLIVSEDGKSVRWTLTPQNVPDNPERFDKYAFVLGCEEFATGRHFWEVAVGSEEKWCIGVAKKHIKRKGKMECSPAGGIWLMGKWGKAYRSCTSSVGEELPLHEEPRKIWVTLNCEGGRLAFYDADRGNLICVYSGAPFIREPLHPFCCLNRNARLTLSF